MSQRELLITLCHRTIDSDYVVVEPLLFPEISCLGDKLPRLLRQIKALVKLEIERSPLYQLHQRLLPSEPIRSDIMVRIDPPARLEFWSEAVELRFDVVTWKHDEETSVSAIPALGIEVVSRDPKALPESLVREALSALRRTKDNKSLFNLALLDRKTTLEIETATLGARVKSPKQLARDEIEGSADAATPVIHDVGSVLNDQSLAAAYEIDAVVADMADRLSGPHPQSLLLVGPSGVGKTAAVHQLVNNRSQFGLSGRPFWSTTGSRLIAGMVGFGMWQERCQRFTEDAKRDNAVVYFGNLIELTEVGRSGASAGVADFFKTPISRGQITAIAECTPEQLAALERRDPQLHGLFHVIELKEPSARTLSKILGRIAGQPLSTDCFAAIEQLHRRYEH
jgi:ATP-dependent Clp protease ATP-binding subunit ClpC